VTLRQTQVLVIPANNDIMSFLVFDALINAINQARRNARDYVTNVSLDRLDERMYGDGGDREWRYVRVEHPWKCETYRR
jgi:hypothetical protein